MVRSFKQIMIFLFLRTFGLEVIERITERKRNERIAGTNPCDGLQVGCDDLTYIPGRIENIPERKRSRQPTAHQLLTNSEIHVPESIRTPLGRDGRTDKVAVHLDTGILKNIERIVPHDIVVRTCLIFTTGFILILHLIMILAAVQVHIPPAGKLYLSAQFDTGRIVVSDIRHRIQCHTCFIRDAQTFDLILAVPVKHCS